jgi:sugar O-acyltransferase (sialic acid O-acetyltransferase NeuD family)
MAERPVIVLGAGGHAKVVVDLLLKLGRKVVAAVEPTAPAKERTLLGVAVHGEDIVLKYSTTDIDLALGIGMPTDDPIAGLAARRRAAARFEARGYSFPPLVHPSAVVAADCDIGNGAQVMAGAILQPGCTVGPFAIVNTRASVDHDCVLGEGCHIAPGATLGGNVRVGAETLIGIGAAVLQGVSIGAGALVGGGAMVIANVTDGQRRVGVPARI